MRTVDRDWEKLFDKYNILKDIDNSGFHVISSTQINEFHEARLMTKFDNKANLPNIFKDNNIAILPITRGNYILGNFHAYENINYDTKVENIPFSLPLHIESIDYENLYSESSCLNCAYVSGIINDLAQEETLPTVSGRMSSNKFDFDIKNIINGNHYNIPVENSQIEVDGGYESINKLILIEAKNFSADDFLIRQLYYPYRLWSNKIQKPVIPVFMTYSNDIFSFFIYDFENPMEYNSIRLLKQSNYIIASEGITLSDLYNVTQTTLLIKEPEIPFPQADNFLRIVDLISLLMDNKELTSDEITNNYAFTYRQTAYYTTAAMYLRLIDKHRNENNEVSYFLTEIGKSIMSRRHKQKYLGIVECILIHEVFNKVLREYFDKASPLSIPEITEVMNRCYLYHVNTQSTVERRAQTVSKWIDWILNLQQ
jgi:hypothetical protein